jgi:hypothetical protein
MIKSQYIIAGIVIYFIVMTIIIKQKYVKKDNNQIIIECVVDSIYKKPIVSVVDYEPTYVFYTDCGTTVYQHNLNYKIGDKITYTIDVDKKTKN